MQFIGTHAEESALRIVRSFGHTEELVSSLGTVFAHAGDPAPSRRLPWHNQLLLALNGVQDARELREWHAVGRSVRAGAQAHWTLAPCTLPTIIRNRFGEDVERGVLYGYRSVPVYAIHDTTGLPVHVMPTSCVNWVAHLAVWDVVEVHKLHHPKADPCLWMRELVHAKDQRLHRAHRNTWLSESVAAIGAATLMRCMEDQHEVDLTGVPGRLLRYAQAANISLFVVCIEVLSRVCECVEAILNTAQDLQSLIIPA